MRTSTIDVPWNDHGQQRLTHLVVQTDDSADPSRPVVILLHGKGGTINHMADPTTDFPINFQLDAPPPDAIMDRGWHWYPNATLWGIILDPRSAARSWQAALNQAGYFSVNYVQMDPDGRLDRAVVELDAVVRTVLSSFPRRVAFVCHSRGGLLLRMFLQSIRSDEGLLSRIAGAVTLHSPHQGSEVADVAIAMRPMVADRLRDNFNPVDVAAWTWLSEQINTDVITDLSPTSALLTNLRALESVPLPLAIPIHTFGGTNPRLVRFWLSIFDARGTVVQWHWPPFHWQTEQKGFYLLDGIPEISSLAPEERSGGDVLVTDVRSHLPGEVSHHTNALSHASILWDPAAQAQALPIVASFQPKAVFVGQSVPQVMNAGAQYQVSITMRNTGSCSWVAGGTHPLRLGGQSPEDNTLWCSNRQAASTTIAPGAQAVFNFVVTAPTTPNAYAFRWRMLQEHLGWFGEATPELMIQVKAAVVSVTLSPASAMTGEIVTGTVVLAAPTGLAALTVNLDSGDPTAAPVPGSVVVGAGLSSVSFTFVAGTVSAATSVSITARGGGGTANAGLTVSPAQTVVRRLEIIPSAITSGQSATATVSLGASAPAGGQVVTLTSNSAAAPVPASVTIGAGQSTASFPIVANTVTAVTSVTVTAVGGGGSASAAVGVNPVAPVARVSTVLLSPGTVTAGQTVTGTVTLTSAAPASGQNVTLSSTNQGVAPVPATLVVPAGSTNASFTFVAGAVEAATSVSVTASGGGGSASASLSVNPASVSSFVLSPTVATAEQKVTGTVTLTSAAPASGQNVTLSSTNQGVAPVPAVLVVPGGLTSASFNFAAGAVGAATSVSVTASAGGGSQSASLSVNPAAGGPPLTFVLSPGAVTAGQTVTGTVTLGSAAPAAGQVVTLTSTHQGVAPVLPAILVQSGSTSATFTILVGAVDAATDVVITASSGGVNSPATFTLGPG